MGHSIEVTDSTFEQEVIKADKPVLIDFWAPWCAPCRMLGPVIEEIASERKDNVKVVKINIDDNQEYAFRLGVMSVPTMLLFRPGHPQPKELTLSTYVQDWAAFVNRRLAA